MKSANKEKIKVDVINNDVTVIGGGLAGVCSAISAARQGMKVALVGDRPVLGGNSSSEVRIWTRGATGGGNLYSEEMGILGEMKLRNLYVNPDGNVIFWDEVILDFVLAEENIELFLNTHITDIEMDGANVTAASGYQLASEKKYQFKSKYYIDCTGDGTVAAAAGMDYYVGMEPESMYGEEYAPESASKNTMGNTIVLYTKRAARRVKYIPPEYAYKMDRIRQIMDNGGRIVDDKQTGSDYWWLEYGGEMDTISDSQQINIELKKLLYGVWDYIKNSGHFDADNLTLEWVGTFGGKRESRRFITDYVLTQKDVFQTKMFADNAFYGGWYLDFHPSSGVWGEENCCTQIPVRTYPVPLRTQFNSSCPNVLLAGRVIGASHAAFASTRDMNTCALSGQSAGTLAAFCIRSGKTPAQEVKDNCRPMHIQMAKDDMLIMDADVRDAKDLAQKAKVTASSSLMELDQKAESSLALSKPSFLCMPHMKHEKNSEIALYADCKEKAELNVKIYKAPMPSRLNPGEFLCEAQLAVPKGERRKLVMEIPPHTDDTFITAVFEENENVSLLGADFAPTGFLMGHQWSMDHMYPLIEAQIGSMYRPEEVINGLSRPYARPNIWISGQEVSPYIMLSWEEYVSASQIMLYLNPDLSREYPSSFADNWNEHHFMAQKLGERPEQLARDFTVSILQEKKWKSVAHVTDNWKRVVKVDLGKAMPEKAVKITFDTNDLVRRAQVFEIRVY